jgi:hypothetical protein
MKALPWVLFAITLIILILWAGCGKNGSDKTTRIDTFAPPPETTYIPTKPQIIYRDTFVYRKIGRVDTLEVNIPYPVTVADSLCQKTYNELYAAFTTQTEVYDGYPLDDSLGFVYITDTLAANQIIGRKVRTELNQRVISKDTIFTKTVERARIRFLLGGGATGNKTGLQYLTGNAGLKDKKDNVYLLGAYKLGGNWFCEVKYLKAF